MRARTIVALFTSALSLHALAISNCPSAHFTPTFGYGTAFGGSKPVSEAKVTKDSDEEVAFDYIEYQTFEPGYSPIFRVSLVKSDDEQSWHIADVRHKKSSGTKPAAIEIHDRAIAPKYARAIVDKASAILLKTRYPIAPCDIPWLDGYVSQAYVEVKGYGELVGEVYAPPENSEAYDLVRLGRALRKYAEHALSESDLEAATYGLNVK